LFWRRGYQVQLRLNHLGGLHAGAIIVTLIRSRDGVNDYSQIAS